MNKRLVKYALIGVAVLLSVKYVILGLNNWNHILHPDRMDNPNSIFARPFLGLF